MTPEIESYLAERMRLISRPALWWIRRTPAGEGYLRASFRFMLRDAVADGAVASGAW